MKSSFCSAIAKKAIAEDTIAANGRSLARQLASLRLFDLRRTSPTFAGKLLFGYRTTHFLPGAFVQFLRLSGDELTSEVIDEKQVSGNLVTPLQTSNC